MSKKKWHYFDAPVLLKVGDRVRLWEEMHGTKSGRRKGTGRPEYGIVVQTINTSWQDCIVAFVGFSKENFTPKKDTLGTRPYFLRYHYTSLEKL